MNTPGYDYFFLVPDADDARVLLVPEGGLWTMPHALSHEFSRWQSVAHVNRLANRLLGMRATTRRCVSPGMDPGAPVRELVYAVENHLASWAPPPGARWAGAGDLDVLTLATPGQRAVLQEWFAWTQTADRSRRVPWYGAGWMTQSGGWIVQQLARLDTQPSGPIEQVCTWQRSCVLHLPTTRGLAYFKAVPAALRTEVDVSVLLDHEYAGMVPEVLAADSDRGWFLMRDMGPSTLEASPDLQEWKGAVRAYAELQVDMVDIRHRLGAAGCLSRGLLQLVESVDRLLSDTVVLRPELPGGLRMEQIHALYELARRLKIAAHRLGTLRLPVSLENGDFWAGQIVRGASNPVFIDWSDAVLSHPFFAMSFFGDEEELRPFFPDAAAACAALRDAYLEPWTVYEPYDVLTQAWTIACRLAPLNAALWYHDQVLPAAEVPWELQDVIPFHLRQVLRHERDVLPTLGMAELEEERSASSAPQTSEVPTSQGPAAMRSQLQTQTMTGPR